MILHFKKLIVFDFILILLEEEITDRTNKLYTYILLLFIHNMLLL